MVQVSAYSVGDARDARNRESKGDRRDEEGGQKDAKA